MKNDEYALAIDLGTTNSVGYLYDGREYRLVDVDSGRILPSCVHYKDDGSIVCGQAAASARGRPRNLVIMNSKRLIGKEFDRKEVQTVMKNCGVNIVNRFGKPVFHVYKKDILNKYVTPIEVASIIIKKIVDRANEMTQKKLGKILVTIPANFDSNQRTATRQAVENVVKDYGIRKDKIEVLNEPTAAAICYGLDSDLNKQCRILVYDFGGGTFDCSILEIKHGSIYVVAHDGNPELGGSDCDKAIAEDLRRLYKETFGEDCFKDIPEDRMTASYRSLLYYASDIKRNLSSSSAVDVDISELFNLHDDDDDDDDHSKYGFEYTREQMNRVIQPLINKTEEVIDRILDENGFSINDIDTAILVGGSSNLICARDMLNRKFGDMRVRRDINPDTCVAHGGCKYLIREDGPTPGITIEECIPFSLGTELVNNHVQWIIPKNTKLPATLEQTVTTVCDYMQSASSCVIQGRSETTCVEPIHEPEHVYLPKYIYKGFKIAPKGVPQLRTIYHYETSGIVHVTVIEKETNKYLFDEDIEF